MKLIKVEAINKSDWKEMKKQVHKLHGSYCYTGVPDLKNLSQQLEESLKLDDNRNSLQVTY
ncbi:Hpt domain-containing protein [Candidatus Coxiella mudrowiae]|uniref:Hpt domain-containing protein n=1 Tax=Candidatus Coxiella mudrowiae TaxID=2054173 RepID=UPI000A42CE8D|nr:Hpt domain-containing protein [Candidatus Coxiella mudrowiae]